MPNQYSIRRSQLRDHAFYLANKAKIERAVRSNDIVDDIGSDQVKLRSQPPLRMTVHGLPTLPPPPTPPAPTPGRVAGADHHAMITPW